MQNRERSRDSPCTLSGPVCNFVGKEKVMTIHLAYNELNQDIQWFKKKNWVIIEMSPAFPVAHLKNMWFVHLVFYFSLFLKKIEFYH